MLVDVNGFLLLPGDVCQQESCILNGDSVRTDPPMSSSRIQSYAKLGAERFLCRSILRMVYVV